MRFAFLLDFITARASQSLQPLVIIFSGPQSLPVGLPFQYITHSPQWSIKLERSLFDQDETTP